MPTYFKLHYHIVFSTQGRDPCLRKEIRPRLWNYMGGIVNGLGAQTRGIGGWIDHVHLLIDIKPSLSVSDVVREIKKASSIWMKETIRIRNFAWQEGYGIFSVGPWDREKVQRYIEDQEDHHRQKTFSEEFVKMLEDAGVIYDPKFLP